MMPDPRVTIAVDGTSASGKSALARGLAQRLGFAHLNTGLLYRGVALQALNSGLKLDQLKEIPETFLSELKNHTFELRGGGESLCSLWIDGEECRSDLSTDPISRAASLVAANKTVREFLVSAQRNSFPSIGIVAEGRDMGTVIFPDAWVKFFVDAPVSVRALRRYSQVSDGKTLEEVTSALIERDERDRNREHAPTVASDSAVLFDNSDGPLEQNVEKMVEIVAERMNKLR